MNGAESRVWKMTGAALLAAGLGIAMTGRAHACSLPVEPYLSPPMPQPGLSPADSQALSATWNIVNRAKREVAERDARIWRQASMFEEAAGVVMVRIDSAGRTSGSQEHPGGLGYVIAKPVLWVKGAGELTEFRLEHTGLTSCGPTPEFDAISSEAGQVFLVYLKSGALQQQEVMGTLAVSRIDEARTLAALDTALN